MVAHKIDLVGEHAIEKGADYIRYFSTCNHPRLTEYNGFCEIRTKGGNGQVIVSPIITVTDDTHYELKINHSDTENLTTLGEFEYDIKFVENTNADVFYSIRGKVQIIDNITELP